MTDYRVENKYLVSDADITVLRHRLAPIMAQDKNQTGGSYEIRSVYFDDLLDSCMQENDSGVDDRRKYRVRSYGPEFSLLRLEIKEKLFGFTRKRSCPLSAEELSQLFEDAQGFPFGERPALNELLLKARCDLMQPKVLIKYERSAYVYPSGNVRITFDRNISASRNWQAFHSDCVSGSVPVLPRGMHIMEVKYDEFLPEHIARQLETGKLQKTTFSKYYLGRLAVNNEFAF